MAEVTAEDDAVQFDAYLDGLLSRPASPRSVPGPHGRDVHRDLEATAVVVQRALSRFHPSFVFEEHLAGRLCSEAGGSELAAVLPFPRAEQSTLADRRSRGLLVSGAIASGVSIAGVSIAGAAILVRRRARPSGRRLAQV